MSKFNNLNPYRMAFDERVIELNGPEIAEIFRWYDEVKKNDSLLAQESSSLIDILERGPIFDGHEPMLVKLKQIDFLFLWYKHMGEPKNELTDKILLAMNSAANGKKRIDLIPPEVLKKMEEEEAKAKAEAESKKNETVSEAKEAKE